MKLLSLCFVADNNNVEAIILFRSLLFFERPSPSPPRFPTPENSWYKISFRYMFMFLSFLSIPAATLLTHQHRSEPTKEAYKFLDEIDRACKNFPDSYASLSLSLSLFAPPFRGLALQVSTWSEPRKPHLRPGTRR